jgi:hypothetical protein
VVRRLKCMGCRLQAARVGYKGRVATGQKLGQEAQQVQATATTGRNGRWLGRGSLQRDEHALAEQRIGVLEAAVKGRR